MYIIFKKNFEILNRKNSNYKYFKILFFKVYKTLKNIKKNIYLIKNK